MQVAALQNEQSVIKQLERIKNLLLDDDNANRWRLVPRQRPPEQSERRKRG